MKRSDILQTILPRGLFGRANEGECPVEGWREIYQLREVVDLATNTTPNHLSRHA